MNIRSSRGVAALAGALLLLSFISAGCAGPAVAQSSIRRDRSPDVPEAALTTVRASSIAFTLDFYHVVRSSNSNLIASPYNLSTVLAQVYAGAGGQTEQQMGQVLHYTLPQDQLHPALNATDLALASTDRSTRLTTANALWGRIDFAFRPDYLDLLARNYGAGLRLMDVSNDTAIQGSTKRIDDWVAQQTQGEIKELLGPDAIQENTRLVLVSTIYFNGQWADAFPKQNTRDGLFTLLNGEQIMVPMMTRKPTNMSYAKDTSFQAADLPYKGGRFRMLILLPAQNQFATFEDGLDSQRLSSILEQLEDRQVYLTMPKFAFGSSFDLARTLATMGMRDVFSDGADLSGMAGQPLKIDAVVHKARIAVDEKGTVAAAAFAAIGEPPSDPSKFVVLHLNRPFVFLIRDMKTGIILFIGHVMNPGQSD
jgi:serpin B